MPDDPLDLLRRELQGARQERDAAMSDLVCPRT